MPERQNEDLIQIGATERTALGWQEGMDSWPGADALGLLEHIDGAIDRIDAVDLSEYPVSLARDMGLMLQIERMALDGLMANIAGRVPSHASEIEAYLRARAA